MGHAMPGLAPPNLPHRVREECSFPLRLWGAGVGRAASSMKVPDLQARASRYGPGVSAVLLGLLKKKMS